MAEQNRKTLRSFYCRDYLWELFEVMTRDLGCSMDYLINESMRHYARSRNYSMANARPQGAPPSPSASGYAPPPAQSPYDYGQQGPGGSYGGYGASAPPSGGYGQPYYGAGSTGAGSTGAGSTGAGSTGAGLAGRGYGPPPGPGGPPRTAAPPPPPAAAPAQRPADVAPSPPPAPVAPVAPVAPGAQPVLFLVFNGQKYKIDKEKFIIGRGSQMTDLTIRDGNISRKHAAVIFRGGKYYLKDLDSTNGIDFQGSRIDSKKIEDGDVFHICDYELRFTSRP